MHWYAITTYHKTEYEAHDSLDDLPLELYLPKEKHWVKIRGGKKGKPPKWMESHRPLIPGYLFVGLRPSQMVRLYSRVRYAKGVQGVLSFDGIPVTIPDFVIKELRERESNGEFVCGKPQALLDQEREADEAFQAAERAINQIVSESVWPSSTDQAVVPEGVRQADSKRRVGKTVLTGLEPVRGLAIDGRITEGCEARVTFGQFKGRIFTVLSIQGAIAILSADLFGRLLPLPLPLDQLEYASRQNNTCQAHKGMLNA